MLSLIGKIQHWLPSILIMTISVRIREGGRERGRIAKTTRMIGSVTLTDLKAGNSKVSNIKVIKDPGLQCRPRVKQLSKYESDLKSKPLFSTQKCDQIKKTENNQNEEKLFNGNCKRKRRRQKKFKPDRCRLHIVLDNG